LNQYGATTHNAVQLRFAGAYQRDDATEVDAVEVVVRGRHSEIDPGTGKSGD
ncbi:phage major tail tube protein, partial [Xanthomonas euvesicatoria]